MVGQLWLDMINGYAQLWGIPPVIMLTIVGILFAIGFAAGLSKLGGGKKFSFMVFLFILWIEVAIGMVDWITIMVPTIIIGGYLFAGGSAVD